jgi:hypothetical protein
LENTQLLKELSMTENKILRVRIVIALAVWLILFESLIPLLKNWSPSPNTLFSFLLLLLSFAMLANGVSFLLEIFKKERKYLKILTGILSFMTFVFILFPQGQDIRPIFRWIILITLFFNPILISVFSLLEFTQVFAILRVYSFVFALFSGIYSFFISSFISRGYGNSESGIGYMIYGVIIFIASMIVNIFTVSTLKNGIRGNS